MRAVIWDLDGTLADTVDDIHASMNAALAGAGLEAVDRAKVVDSVGGGMAKLVERIVDAAGRREEVQRRFREHYEAHLLVKTRLFPGAAEALEALKDHPMAVLSNKPAAMTRSIVEGLGIAGRFRVVYGGDSLPVRKPDPATVRRVLADLGVGAEAALLVGDSRYDVETGRNAGVATCAVTWGYAKPGELEGADYVVGTFDGVVAAARST
jgi:phosphoglycolate phosphatase